MPYIQKISKDTLGCHSSNEMPDGHWHKGSTTTVMCRYVEHLTATRQDLVAGEQVAELIDSRLHQIIFYVIGEGLVLFLSWCSSCKEAAAAKTLNRAMSALYNSDVWMSASEASRVSDLGLYFLRAYARLAWIHYSRNEPRFPLFTKLHMLFHTFYSMYEQSRRISWVLNPIIEACPQDEDFVGKVSRTSRRVGTRKIVQSALRRYLIQCHQVWFEGH